MPGHTGIVSFDDSRRPPGADPWVIPGAGRRHEVTGPGPELGRAVIRAPRRLMAPRAVKPFGALDITIGDESLGR